MKKKLQMLILLGCNILFIGACNGGCSDIVTHVGGGIRVIVVTDGPGGDVIVQSDVHGNVTHPCGTTITHNQIHEDHL